LELSAVIPPFHMPSIPHSPPETPLKLQSEMAVDSATPARKRHPDSPLKGLRGRDMSPGLNSPIKVEKPTQSQVKIPPSAQPPESDQAGNSQETESQEEVETGPDGSEKQAENIPQDLNAELPEFDYNRLNAECAAAVNKASEEEDKLLDEFNAYAEVSLLPRMALDLMLIRTSAFQYMVSSCVRP